MHVNKVLLAIQNNGRRYYRTIAEEISWSGGCTKLLIRSYPTKIYMQINL